MTAAVRRMPRLNEFHMPNKMLIDASHPEETRVVVLRGNRVEEFDFESADKKQLRGNIYLAKVTRVEPSLQAAFVDYGGNRHGFLAFSEIHPDYYQIPVSDRQELLQEDAAAHRDEEEEGRRRSRRHRRGERGERAEKRRGEEDEKLADTQLAELETAAASGETEQQRAQRGLEDHAEPEAEGDAEPASEQAPESDVAAPLHDVAEDANAPAVARRDTIPAHETAATGEDHVEAQHARHRLATDPEGFAIVEDEPALALEPVEAEVETRLREKRHIEEEEGDEEDEQIEQIGGDAMEEVPMRPHRPRRQYKIQEVIKRRQVLLVQVVKEERGNKGAALTTYLSLAGRYSVLMPNTARGGGISRKITDAGDRQRLKAIAQDLEVPEGMGVILRTAGAARTKAEVKRDFEYLLRMWETVREMTLQSTAPTLVYEEGSLIKRAIRDLYNKDIDEVIVSGEPAYREAKEFMRMLMPSHAKNVHLYRDPQPIFAKSGVEAQLDAMFTNQVTLKSGGYLVINQTEALVAIDVNSGRSTREHDIEDTALRTNLEAADEIARQLRLRDLAGLIVVDFIDMEESRNNRAVERRMKEALKNDRARIQIGRISHFGLLEMSRQRIRTGVLEGSTVICSHCGGAGTVRSTSSIALHVLRLLEDALIKSAAHNITVRTRSEVALYILNQKRANLRDLEQRFGVSITIIADDTLTGTAYHAMERGEPAVGVMEPPRLEAPQPIEAIESEEALAERAEHVEHAGPGESAETGEEEAARRKRRRRRRRGRGGEREHAAIVPASQPSDDALALVAGIGGSGRQPREVEDLQDEQGAAAEMMPKRDGGRRRRSRRRGRGGARPEADTSHVRTTESATEGPSEPAAARAAPPAQTRAMVEAAFATPVKPQPEEALKAPDAEAQAGEAADSASDANRPKRTGWWRRAKESLGG
jgi:ribonuclease E